MPGGRQSAGQGLLRTLQPLSWTTEEEKGGECLAPGPQDSQRTECEGSWILPLATPYPGLLLLPSSNPAVTCLVFIPFRAASSPKGQQMVPVSHWTALEETGASLPASHPPLVLQCLGHAKGLANLVSDQGGWEVRQRTKGDCGLRA